MKNFLETRSNLADEALCKYYYKGHISILNDGIIIENGDFLSYAEIEELRKYILREFQIEGLNQTTIIT